MNRIFKNQVVADKRNALYHIDNVRKGAEDILKCSDNLEAIWSLSDACSGRKLASEDNLFHSSNFYSLCSTFQALTFDEEVKKVADMQPTSVGF